MSTSRPGEAALPTILLALLSEADAALDNNRETTRECLKRACALVERDCRAAQPDDGHGSPPFARGSLAPWQMGRTLRTIAEGMARPLPIAELAAQVGLSISYFSRAFRASQGLSPHDFILQQRVQQAQKLMLTTDEPLSQIALACGFCDQAHLTRSFRRRVGASPAVWRRQVGFGSAGATGQQCALATPIAAGDHVQAG